MATICIDESIPADHKEALGESFARMYGLLEHEGLVSPEQVMHDGTKIRAQAGGDTLFPKHRARPSGLH
jgi:hypothetical protein